MNEKKKSEIVQTDTKYGYFTDQRDRHRYKVVKIGKQIWFAENLACSSSSGFHLVYGNNEKNAAK